MYLDHIYERFFVIFTNKCNIGGEKKSKPTCQDQKDFLAFCVLQKNTQQHSNIYIYIYIKWSNTYSVTRGLDGEDKEDKKI